MFELKYVSAGGTVTLGGGNHPLMRVRSITGIGLPPREYTQCNTADAGQLETGRHDGARTITVSGDLLGDGASLDAFERVVYFDGYLYLTFGTRARRIACKLYAMADQERICPNRLTSFSVQFLCDTPYFEDASATVESLMEITNSVSSEFTLPCVFATSENAKQIVIHGAKSVYPILRIGCVSVGEGEVHGVHIKNHTTGKSMVLNHAFSAGESVTINLGNRTVISDVHGSVINELSDDTDLAEMYLAPGDNQLEVTNLSGDDKLLAEVEFRSEYFSMEY